MNPLLPLGAAGAPSSPEAKWSFPQSQLFRDQIISYTDYLIFFMATCRLGQCLLDSPCICLWLLRYVVRAQRAQPISEVSTLTMAKVPERQATCKQLVPFASQASQWAPGKAEKVVETNREREMERTESNTRIVWIITVYVFWVSIYLSIYLYIYVQRSYVHR